MKTKVETIIVGGGVAGLACALALQEAGRDFLMITKNIGGRIVSSADGSVNYGAYFVCSDYFNVRQLVEMRGRMKLHDLDFHKTGQAYPLFSLSALPFIPQFAKLWYLLIRFNYHFQKYRRAATMKSQKQVIESDAFLYDLYQLQANEFMQLHGLEKVTEKYLSELLYAATFSAVSEMNAFVYLQYLLPLITPTYTFKFNSASYKKKLKQNLIMDEVLESGWNN